MFIHLGALAAAFLVKQLPLFHPVVRSDAVIIPPAPEYPHKTFCALIKDDVCCARYPEGIISCNPVAPRAQNTPNTETVMVTVTRTRTTTTAAPTVTEDDKEDVLEEMAKKLQDAYMLYRQTRKRGGKDGN
ncbi:hypothetical protein V8F33_010869 [Rhypophila sp. PSN 637]